MDNDGDGCAKIKKDVEEDGGSGGGGREDNGGELTLDLGRNLEIIITVRKNNLLNVGSHRY